MPVSDSEYQDALREVSAHLDALGLDIIGNIDEQEGDLSIDGFLVDAAGRSMAVSATKDHEWFRVEYEFDVRTEYMEIDQIESHLQEKGIRTDEEVRTALEEGIETDLNDITHEDFVEAAQDDIENINHKKLNHALISHLASGENMYSVYNDGGVVFGFNVGQRLFAYDDSFGKPEIHSTIQTLVNTTSKPVNLLSDAYDVQQIDLSTADDGQGFDPNDPHAFR